ncbi:hypothetical protein CBS101457_006359 [Exobasidium rhododendri]|nr:hypothetical protein CBS101457_006359 [Exobasidium rhododendri]
MPATFPSSFEKSPRSSFIESNSYSVASSTPSYTHSSEAHSIPTSTTGSYDSQHVQELTGRQFYDNSGLTGTILSEALRSNSLNSNFTSTGQEGLLETLSPKVSMTALQDAHFPSNLVQSPEYEDTSASIGWKPASLAAVQATPGYDFRYTGGNSALPTTSTNPAAYYSTDQMNAGPSQINGTFGYANAGAMQIMAQGNISSNLPMSTSVDSFRNPTAGILPSAPNGFSSQSLINSDSSIAAQTLKSNSQGRANTSGSTRRAKFQRSRTGCMVCRKRKVKCDQDGQPCKQCRIGKRECHYEENPTKRKRKSKIEEEPGRKRRGKASEGDEGSSSTSVNVKMETGLKDEYSYPKERIGVADMTEDQARQALEAAEDLKRTTDALFAQHTNLDQVDLGLVDDGECVKAEEGQDSFEQSDQVDSFSLQYTNDDDSTDSIEPWTTGPMAEDWTISTPSTAPSSHKTVEGDNMGSNSFHSMIRDGGPDSFNLDDKSPIGSPFNTYMGGKEGKEDIITIEEGTGEGTWYAHHQNDRLLPDSALSMGLGLEGGELCLLSQETA